MLSKKALLVSVGISQWVGRKLDKRATGTVETSHATDHNVGNYTKKLLPGAYELEKIQATAGMIRKYYYRHTLPWMADGARIISGAHLMEFMAEFRKMKNEFDHAVGGFLAEYPKLQLEAKRRLGDLYNEKEYPSVEKLTKLYKCDVTLMPMAEVGDFRVEILDSEKEDYLKKMREVESEAVRECYARLHEVVSRATEKLGQPGAVFRDTLIENIQDICDLLPKLNVTDNADLEATRLKVVNAISKISPDLCRESQDVRADAAAKLKEIQNSMGSFMGDDNGNTV